MGEMKPCPFCGEKPYEIDCGDYTDVSCISGCPTELMGDGIWNKRPIEDGLRAELAKVADLWVRLGIMHNSSYADMPEFDSITSEIDRLLRYRKGE